MLQLKDALIFEQAPAYLHSALSGSAMLAASRDGRISVYSLGSRAETVNLQVGDGLGGAWPHPSKPVLAFINEKSGLLRVLAFDGATLCEQSPASLPAGSPEWLAAGYLDCAFDASGERLWSVARVSMNQLEVQIRETQGWSVVSSVLVEDPFGGAEALLDVTPAADTLSLWVAAGQDGQCVYWVKHNGGQLDCRRADDLEYTTPPTFGPNGKELLVVDEEDSLRKFSYPTLRAGRRCASPFGEDPFAMSVNYLNATRAIVGSADGRIALVDTARMKCVGEIIIEGHEPRPTSEYYPGLTDQELCTDLFMFRAVGDLIVFVYQPREEPRRLAQLLCYPAKHVLDHGT